ncbi:MAG: hypothetical protein R2873_00510 [Caldilineaceae bacterium]
MPTDSTLRKLFDLVDERRDELIDLHQRLVQCATVNTGAADSGNEVEACRILANYFEQHGIDSTTVESAPYPRQPRGQDRRQQRQVAVAHVPRRRSACGR